MRTDDSLNMITFSGFFKVLLGSFVFDGPCQCRACCLRGPQHPPSSNGKKERKGIVRFLRVFVGGLILLVLACGGVDKVAGSPGLQNTTSLEERFVVGRDNRGRRLLLYERQGYWMSLCVAQAYDRLAAHARRDGVDLKIKGGYRSYQDQITVARRYGLYENGGLAARPGTSPHGGRNTALDLDDGRGYRWLARVAPLYGFHAPICREKWHFELKNTDSCGPDEPERKGKHR